MNYNNSFSDKNFSWGHKTLTWGTFFFSGTLFLLAVLIFAYPAFIAGLILLAGISTLTVAWKLRQFRKNVSHLEQWEEPVTENDRYWTRITYFRWHA